MTSDESLAFSLLESFSYAVLRRTGPREYVFFGHPPAFYTRLFPPDANGPCRTPWKTSPMLEFFLDEAEDFFAGGQTGRISTGVWEEDGLTQENTALKAVAFSYDGAQAIVICLQEEEYAERLGILRKAREQLQENRVLTNNLSFFKEKSRIDGLTCIFNRATFMELLEDEIRRSQILDYPLALMILDIDNFKHVNDTYGHLTGDAILVGIGGTLKHTLRRNDIIARYGGEEFAVLVSHAPMHEAEQIAEKIRAAVEAMETTDAPRITASIGCTAYIPGEKPQDFFKRTDDALYTAKRTGKNRVCVGEVPKEPRPLEAGA